MELLRDGDEFTIPGGSIAGAARSRLAMDFAQTFQDGIPSEPAWMRALFGGGDEMSGTMSALSVPDCGPKKGTPGKRDGVAIAHDTGGAEDRARYVVEVLPVGTEFVFNLELRVFEPPADGVTADELLAGFRTLLEQLSSEKQGVWLGAKTRAGFGRGLVKDWKVAVLDMNKKGDVKRWLQRGLGAFTFLQGEELDRAFQGTAPLAAKKAARKLIVDGIFRLKTSMIIRSHSTEKNEPDYYHLTERSAATGSGPAADYYPVPGTSLRGPFRKRCRKILLTLDWVVKDADELIDGLFGPRFGGKHGTKDPRASRVVFEESTLDGVELRVQGRVAIDRFTQAALDSHLFQEAAAWPKDGAGKLHLHYELRDPSDQQAAVLLLALKDFCLADVPLGGEVGVGRGIFEVQEVCVTIADEHASRILIISSEGKGTAGDVQYWNAKVATLRQTEAVKAEPQGVAR
jgi:CRISPR/Cas system CSM-associated protein Csm3 (group 7 of RAMP superfamily)